MTCISFYFVLNQFFFNIKQFKNERGANIWTALPLPVSSFSTLIWEGSMWMGDQTSTICAAGGWAVPTWWSWLSLWSTPFPGTVMAKHNAEDWRRTPRWATMRTDSMMIWLFSSLLWLFDSDWAVPSPLWMMAVAVMGGQEGECSF